MIAGNFNFSKNFYRVATVPAFLISAMLTYLLVEYSVHGAKALEVDAEMKALAALVAVVLALSQLAGSTYAALLSGQSLTLRCFGLRTLAYFICAVEFCTSVGMQLSTTLGADMVQTQVSTREESLKERIKKFEDSAREKKDGALKQEAAACKIKSGGKQVCGAWELSLAAKQRQGATADTDKAEALQAELKAVQAQKKPSFVGSVGQAGGILGFDFDAGKAFAVMLIVARMLGLCAGALLFSELAGAMLKRGWPSFRAPASPAPKAAFAPMPANAPAQVQDAPAQVQVRLKVQEDALAKPDAPAAPRPRTFRDRPRFRPEPAAPAPSMPFGFVPPTAPQARHDAPSSGAVWSAPQRDYSLRPSRPTAPAPTAPAAPAPTNAPAQVQDAPVEVQKAKSASAPPPVPDGVRNAIKAGAISPTLRGIKSMARGQDFAVAWLAELGAEGVLESAGNGRWRLRRSA